MLTLSQMACGKLEEDHGTPNMRKLSENQRDILLWLAEQFVKTGVTLVPWKHSGPWTASARASESRSLCRLEKRGLVARCNLHGDGQRTTHVELTEAGLKLCGQLMQAEMVNR